MKIPYFIIIMFLCPLALVGQEINLLPEPWKVEKKEGVFTLSVSTKNRCPYEPFHRLILKSGQGVFKKSKIIGTRSDVSQTQPVVCYHFHIRNESEKKMV